MSFTMKIKEEIASSNIKKYDEQILINAFIKYSSRLNENITFTLENPLIARKIYNYIVDIYNIKPGIKIRIQKRFKTKRIYILSIAKNNHNILDNCKIKISNNRLINDEYSLNTIEEKKYYIKGAFLACGSLNDPSTSGYHMELVFSTKKSAEYIKNILQEFKVSAKVLKRSNKYMVYVKSSEEISDVLKILEVNQSLFYFEDIRTQKDHINMINRLNNCEQANQDKTIKTGLSQINDINYLKEHDLINLLDEKTQIVVTYREKYPELSYQELADIITLESGYKISKSGVNHHFIKIRNLTDKHKNKSTAK